MSTLPQITLYQPPGRPWNTPNLSPFCAKLETYLRFAEIPHSVKPANVPKAPKGKIPYVKIGEEYMGDSQLIIERLEKLNPPGLDHNLTASQRAVSHTVRRMLDEAYYFVMMSMRWDSEHTFTHQKEQFVKVLPAPLRLAFPLIVRNVRKTLRVQGTGRHTTAEVNGFGCADVSAVAELLGDKPYFHGDAPTTVDASIYGFMTGTLAFPGESALKTHLSAQKNLLDYCDRITHKYYKELL